MFEYVVLAETRRLLPVQRQVTCCQIQSCRTAWVSTQWPEGDRKNIVWDKEDVGKWVVEILLLNVVKILKIKQMGSHCKILSYCLPQTCRMVWVNIIWLTIFIKKKLTGTPTQLHAEAKYDVSLVGLLLQPFSRCSWSSHVASNICW